VKIKTYASAPPGDSKASGIFDLKPFFICRCTVVAGKENPTCLLEVKKVIHDVPKPEISPAEYSGSREPPFRMRRSQQSGIN
jgi:hypothetical protein